MQSGLSSASTPLAIILAQLQSTQYVVVTMLTMQDCIYWLNTLTVFRFLPHFASILGYHHVKQFYMTFQ